MDNNCVNRSDESGGIRINAFRRRPVTLDVRLQDQERT